jgi:myo-inositol-1-phosphate synthase
MGKIRVALAGVGNCCSALIQGVHYYKSCKNLGLLHKKIGSYYPRDIEFVTAFDIDNRKVGKDLSNAIFSEPNKMPKTVTIPNLGIIVLKGPVMDAVENQAEELVIVNNSGTADVVQTLKDTESDILVNMVSGSAIEASKFYARAALKAGCAFLNATPAPICIDKILASKYRRARLPISGDDLLDQIGATVTHMALLEFLDNRGVHVDESYQLDVGGGAESVNTLWKTRDLKRDIKTTAVSKSLPYDFPLVSGSTDYVDFLGNKRDSFFWFKGKYFGGAPFTMDVKLNTLDAPNAGSVLLDIIRGLKIAKEKGVSGPVDALCSYGFKMPPIRLGLLQAYKSFKNFVES